MVTRKKSLVEWKALCDTVMVKRADLKKKSSFCSFWKNRYIGETGRRTSDQFLAHLRDVVRKDKDASKRKRGKTLAQIFTFQIGIVGDDWYAHSFPPEKWPSLPPLRKKNRKKTGPLKGASVSVLCEISSLYAIRECRFYNEDYLKGLYGSMVIYAINFMEISLQSQQSFFPLSRDSLF